MQFIDALSYRSILLAIACFVGAMAGAVEPGDLPKSAAPFTVETDDEAGTTTVTLPATGGLIAWADIIRAAAQLGRLDDSALSQLPSGTLDIDRSDSRLAIAALDLVLPPEISVKVVERVDAAEPGLKLTVDRQRLRERNRDVKKSLRATFGTAQRRYGLVLDEDWESRASGRSVVVLIHGYNSTTRSLAELHDELNRCGWPCAVFDFPNDGPIDESGRLLSEELRSLAQDHAEQPVAIVAHSMGGLVARVVIEDPELDPGNVRQLIMVATPNHGSQMAHFACGLECCEHVLPRRDRDAESLLRLSIADGLNEARSDLKPGSRFLRELNARERNPEVRYSLLLGTQGPLTASQLEELQSAVATAAEHNRIAQLLAPRIAGPLADMEELLDGAGDGAVAVKRGRLEGVDDTELLPFSHLAVAHTLELAAVRELREAIVTRLSEPAAAALDTGCGFRQNNGSDRQELELPQTSESP